MNEIKINKQAKSITIINNGIAFSQFGIAKEILDLVDNQQQEIERLNNIINRIDNFVDRTIEVIKQQSTGDEWILERLNGIKYLTELKDN